MTPITRKKRLPVVPGRGVVVNTQEQSEVQKSTSEVPTLHTTAAEQAKKPTLSTTRPRRKITPKGGDTDGETETKASTTKPRSEGATGASESPSELTTTRERENSSGGPGEAVQGASTKEQRLTEQSMRALTLRERVHLSKELNTASEELIPLLKIIPKQVVMRKLEAIQRGVIPEQPPKEKGVKVYYCPYCVDWQVFLAHAWSGYTQCCGCTISTRDFYTRADNELFNKD